MNRSPRTRTWIGAAAVVAFLTSLLFLVGNPTSADAQAGTDPEMSIAVSPADATQPFRTIAVGFDPGGFGVAALGVTLHFDAAQISAASCEVSEAGACNVTADGTVLASVFNLGGLKVNEQLVTVNFEPTAGASGTTQFEVSVDTAVNFQGEALDTIASASVDLEMAAAEFGSLTGDVIDQESATPLYALDVCVTHDLSQAELCTTTSGLGTWRIDDLLVGGYTIAVHDPAGVYAPAATISTVSADQVTAGIENFMVLASVADAAADADADADGDSSSDAAGDATLPVFDGPPTEYTVVVYGASIAGSVSAIDTGETLQALQVCATQPLVLHQSCSTTDADGGYALDGLSTGNYWITVVDPLGLFEEVRPKLIGVVGDDVARDGVQIRLLRIAG